MYVTDEEQTFGNLHPRSHEDSTSHGDTLIPDDMSRDSYYSHLEETGTNTKVEVETSTEPQDEERHGDLSHVVSEDDEGQASPAPGLAQQKTRTYYTYKAKSPFEFLGRTNVPEKEADRRTRSCSVSVEQTVSELGLNMTQEQCHRLYRPEEQASQGQSKTKHLGRSTSSTWDFDPSVSEHVSTGPRDLHFIPCNLSSLLQFLDTPEGNLRDPID